MTHYSREDWHARTPAPGPGRLDPRHVEGIALHYPGMPKPLTAVAAVMSSLRSWQAYHMDTHGWSDIAYQVAIDQAGNTYRLRGLRNQSGANGDTDVNERFGALLLVLANDETPTQALVSRTRHVITRHRRLFPSSTRIVGHRDIRPEPTSCPGDKVEHLIAAGTFNPRQENK